MQFNYANSPCSGDGYLPHPWPAASDTSDLPLYPARCNDPKAQPSYHGADGILQRGSNMVPPVGSSGAASRTAAGSTAPAGSTGAQATGGLQSILLGNAWMGILNGPVTTP